MVVIMVLVVGCSSSGRQRGASTVVTVDLVVDVLHSFRLLLLLLLLLMVMVITTRTSTLWSVTFTTR